MSALGSQSARAGSPTRRQTSNRDSAVVVRKNAEIERLNKEVAQLKQKNASMTTNVTNANRRLVETGKKAEKVIRLEKELAEAKKKINELTTANKRIPELERQKQRLQSACNPGSQRSSRSSTRSNNGEPRMYSEAAQAEILRLMEELKTVKEDCAIAQAERDLAVSKQAMIDVLQRNLTRLQTRHVAVVAEIDGKNSEIRQLEEVAEKSQKEARELQAETKKLQARVEELHEKVWTSKEKDEEQATRESEAKLAVYADQAVQTEPAEASPKNTASSISNSTDSATEVIATDDSSAPGIEQKAVNISRLPPEVHVTINITPSDKPQWALLARIQSMLPEKSKLDIFGPPELVHALATSMQRVDKDLVTTTAQMAQMRDLLWNQAQQIERLTRNCSVVAHRNLEDQIAAKDAQLQMQNILLAAWWRDARGHRKGHAGWGDERAGG